MLTKRKLLSANIKEKYSHEIVRSFLKSPEFSNAEVILCYVSTPEEVSTIELIETAWKLGKRVGVPKVLESREMEFFEIQNFEELCKGYKGILEPFTEKRLILSSNENTLVIVPGTVFDKHFQRMGYGGGFYDCYLQKHPDYVKIAFAFSMQVIEQVPAEKHDVSMDFIYTEKGKIQNE